MVEIRLHVYKLRLEGEKKYLHDASEMKYGCYLIYP